MASRRLFRFFTTATSPSTVPLPKFSNSKKVTIVTTNNPCEKPMPSKPALLQTVDLRNCTTFVLVDASSQLPVKFAVVPVQPETKKVNLEEVKTKLAVDPVFDSNGERIEGGEDGYSVEEYSPGLTTYVTGTPTAILSATYEKATLEDIEAVTGVHVVERPLEIPTEIDLEQDDWLLTSLRKTIPVWALTSETARRTIIDLFLISILSLPQFHGKMKAFTEQAAKVENATLAGKRTLSGRPDYFIGHGEHSAIVAKQRNSLDTNMLVLEAKLAWFDCDITQAIAGSAGVHKARKDSGKKNRQVFGVLTNARIWQFLHIDNEGVCRISDVFALNWHDATWESIRGLYSALYYIVNQAFDSSPTTSVEDINA